jgi:hypothetical protein
MAKFKVTYSSLFVHGVKYRRGDIVELDSAEKFGTKLEPYHEPKVAEPVKAAPKRTRRKKVEVSDENS